MPHLPGMFSFHRLLGSNAAHPGHRHIHPTVTKDSWYPARKWRVDAKQRVVESVSLYSDMQCGGNELRGTYSAGATSGLRRKACILSSSHMAATVSI